MYPIFSDQDACTLTANRKELLALAERERLVREYGVATGFVPGLTTLAGRIRTGFGGVLGTLVRFRGARPVQIGDEVAATPSA